MSIYAKYVSAKRSSEELILEKMKTSTEFNNVVNVLATFIKLNESNTILFWLE